LNLRILCAAYASPGYSSERFHFYYATVNESDKETAGGGLEEENEYIEVVEMKYDAWMNLAAGNQLNDAKALLATLYVRLRGNYGWKK
jgi:GDP-mannose pyrophosphatase NudK